ncbi:MAG: carboxypeptidase regulatory-like domain-containing protein [Ignavibacteriaceae bacterium]|nr:carboxypeptidase regulatory-like domain-containing protein [Ignavibacteriaceae bacterium]
MKKLAQLFATVIFVCSLFTVNSYSQMMNTVTVTGNVYAASELSNDTTSTPIANAVVSLHSFVMVGKFMPGDSILYQATTDSEGKFKISGVIPGQYMLMASATGYETLALRTFEVGTKKDTVSINLFLRDSAVIKGGIVSGKVKFDSSGRGFSRAIIEFINASQNHANIFTTTDWDGDFSAKVPAGQYYISCTIITMGNMLFFQEYYDNVTSIADAKIVTVADGQTITGINFDLPDHVSEKHNVTFSGNVQSSTGTILPGTIIKIWASNEHDRDDQKLIALTKTDTLGDYSVTLDSIAQSKNTFVVSAHKDGYKLQFYNGQSTFYQANKLFAFNDTSFTGVNFSLVPNDTTAKFTLSGTVTDTANAGINGAFVVLFDSTNGHIHSSITDSTGSYIVNNLAAGSYFVLFYAHGYVPQFYLNADKWENATLVHLTASVTGINVTLKSLDSLTAGGEIAGTIHSKDGHSLPGTLISVKNSVGVTVASSITDDSGSYSISGLVQGSYTVTASVTQYTSQQQSVTYDPSFGTTSINNFSLSTASVTGVTSQTSISAPTKFALENNYPNPFNPSTIISFTLPLNSRVHLEVYNILGQKVAELLNKQMDAGSYSINFNAVHLSSGVYLYRLQTDHFTATKKMILAK